MNFNKMKQKQIPQNREKQAKHEEPKERHTDKEISKIPLSKLSLAHLRLGTQTILSVVWYPYETLLEKTKLSLTNHSQL